jgi:hypothetical protein
VIDQAGNTSGNVTASVQSTLTITILSPVEGATITNNQVNIEGKFNGPANTGILINGVQADVMPEGKFIVNALPLIAGNNVITATATTLGGQTSSATITVLSEGVAQSFEFKPASTSGVAPFTTTFELSWFGTETIQNIEVDYEGDGVVDISTTNVDEVFQASYTSAGIFYPLITITTENNISKGKVAILVQSRTNMVNMFTSIWNDMNVALVNGNIESALKHLDEFGKVEYGPVFKVLKDKMPEIVQSYSVPKGVLITNSVGELAINRIYKGQNRIYLIYFMKDKDGLWKLNRM